MIKNFFLMMTYFFAHLLFITMILFCVWIYGLHPQKQSEMCSSPPYQPNLKISAFAHMHISGDVDGMEDWETVDERRFLNRNVPWADAAGCLKGMRERTRYSFAPSPNCVPSMPTVYLPKWTRTHLKCSCTVDFRLSVWERRPVIP